MYPNFKKQFILQTDASFTDIGAVLSQLDGDGKDCPIAFCSRVPDVHEKNYAVTEKECLAVIFACKQFRVYINGTHL